ncbi:MAG TPA: Yip1 family protein [Puia sp.]|nr:Yip1 family protein [Puia sp.]
MAIFDRAKNILLSPKTEWQTISTETETPQSLLMKYVIPMALIPAIALFIGYGLIGFDVLVARVSGLGWGVEMAVISFISSIIGYYISTYVVDALAPNFGSEKNIGRSAQLVAYSYTASWVAGIFFILPSLSILALLGLYGIYLLYLGLPVLKKTPADKQIGYIAVSIIVIIIVVFVIRLIISKITYAIVGDPFLGELDNMHGFFR